MSEQEPRAALRSAAEREDDSRVGSLLAAAEQRRTDPDTVEQLAVQAQAGDVQARERLIEQLLPLVSSLARSYRVDGLDHRDLVQEGIVGLLRALRRYDPNRGTPFRAWATWWVRQALQEARSDFVRPLRLPRHALRQLAQLKAEHERIYAREQRNARLAEVASRTGIELSQAEALLRIDPRPRSLDEPVPGPEGELGTLGTLLEDPLAADDYEEVLDTLAGEQLRALLSRLTEREREIIDARFGFGRPKERLAEIGDRLGISAERVRQLEERALAKLRHAVAAGEAD
jgi:RNA polymerase sigma factor (sigma-70 family)